MQKQIDFNPTNPRHEAGITVFLNIHFHNEIAVTIHPKTGVRTIVTHTRFGPNGTLNTTYHSIPQTGTVKLFIKAQSTKYSLGYAVGNKLPNYVAEVSSRWLQAYLKGWQNFTGTFFGVFATGNGWPMLVPAVSCVT